MSEREFQGYVTIRQQSDHSMFTLRASLASSKVKAALKTCLNVAVPKRGTYAQTGETLLAWMSPDELLIMVPKDAGGAAFAALEQLWTGCIICSRMSPMPGRASPSKAVRPAKWWPNWRPWMSQRRSLAWAVLPAPALPKSLVRFSWFKRTG